VLFVAVLSGEKKSEKQWFVVIGFHPWPVIYQLSFPLDIFIRSVTGVGI